MTNTPVIAARTRDGKRPGLMASPYLLKWLCVLEHVQRRSPLTLVGVSRSFVRVARDFRAFRHSRGAAFSIF